MMVFSLYSFLYLISVLVTLSCSTWLYVWLGMELSLMCMLPLLFWSSGSVLMGKSATFKYFCIQAVGSSLLFLSGLNIWYPMQLYWVWFPLFICALFFKLGFFPGHFWVGSTVDGLSWMGLVLVLFVQKVPGTSLLEVLITEQPSLKWICCVLALCSVIFGAWIGNAVTSIRWVLGASSIVQGGWMIMGATCGGLWIYLTSYGMTMSFLLFSLMRRENMIFSLLMISMSGIPPFIMFVAKLIIIQSMVVNDIPFFYILMFLLCTILALPYYLKFSYSFFLDWALKHKQYYYKIIPAVILQFVGSVTLFIIYTYFWSPHGIGLLSQMRGFIPLALHILFAKNCSMISKFFYSP